MLHGGDSVHVWCAVLSPQLLKANELNLALIAAIPAFVVRHRVVGCTLETASHGCSTMLQAAVWAAELRGTDSGSLILGKGCGGWQHVSVLAWDAGKPSGGLLCQSWMQLLTGPGSPWVFCRSSVNPSAPLAQAAGGVVYLLFRWLRPAPVDAKYEALPCR